MLIWLSSPSFTLPSLWVTHKIYMYSKIMPCWHFLLAGTVARSVLPTIWSKKSNCVNNHYIGLAALGIDPSSGKSVGSYVVGFFFSLAPVYSKIWRKIHLTWPWFFSRPGEEVQTATSNTSSSMLGYPIPKTTCSRTHGSPQLILPFVTCWG